MRIDEFNHRVAEISNDPKNHDKLEELARKILHLQGNPQDIKRAVEFFQSRVKNISKK